jgi:hypothetical protein
MAELLIDLEEDPDIRDLFAAELKVALLRHSA